MLLLYLYLCKDYKHFLEPNTDLAVCVCTWVFLNSHGKFPLKVLNGLSLSVGSGQKLDQVAVGKIPSLNYCNDSMILHKEKYVYSVCMWLQLYLQIVSLN